MAKEQWTSQYFLAADEDMQLDLTSVNLLEVKNNYSFLVRSTCIEVLNKQYGSKVPFQMVIILDPKMETFMIRLDIVDWTTVNPINLKKIVELLQSSPQFTQQILLNIEERIALAESHEILELMQLKKFYISTLQSAITNFTVSRQAKDLVYLFDLQKIKKSSKFTMSDQGGKLKFTFTVGFTHNSLIQLYDISCHMYMFIDGEKLGYYFEFFLDRDNYHHQEIYRALPDQLMESERFLHLVAQIMDETSAPQHEQYLKDLISIFRASI